MKLVLKLVGVLIVLLAAVFIYLTFNLGQIVKEGIEHYGPPMLGTDVSVGSVQLSPLSGSGAISTLKIRQPKGYGSSDAIALGNVAIELNIRSLTSDTIIIKRIAINAPSINLVQLASGNNIKVLADNIQQNTGGAGQQAAPTEQARPGKKIIIDDLTISNATVSASSPLLKGGTPIELRLANIHITDIGRKANGERVGDAVQTIAKRLQQEVGKVLANSGAFQQQIRQKIEEEARSKLKGKLGGDKSNLLKGLLKQ